MRKFLIAVFGVLALLFAAVLPSTADHAVPVGGQFCAADHEGNVEQDANEVSLICEDDDGQLRWVVHDDTNGDDNGNGNGDDNGNGNGDDNGNGNGDDNGTNGDDDLTNGDTNGDDNGTNGDDTNGNGDDNGADDNGDDTDDDEDDTDDDDDSDDDESTDIPTPTVIDTGR